MPARVVTFSSIDGLRLEGRYASPPSPRGAAVLCHAPKPAGGLMPNVLMPSLQRALEAGGWASLRFNYRGIGRSEGWFDAGRGGRDDVCGAIAYLRRSRPDLPCAVIGWSSGALIALDACAAETGVDVFVGLSPPVDPSTVDDVAPFAALHGWQARSLLVAAAGDPACDAGAVRALAGRLGGEVEIVDDADHGFTGRLAELGAIVTWFLR